MSTQWSQLFDDTEPDAIAGLLSDPPAFADRAATLCRMLVMYLEAHNPPGAGQYVRLTDAEALLGTLVELHGRAAEGQDLNAEAATLVARYDAFLAEGWPNIPSMQRSPALRADTRRRDAFERIQHGRRVTTQQAADVRAMNTELQDSFPMKTPRYQEIAKRLDVAIGRVRYIIEGPRPKKN